MIKEPQNGKTSKIEKSDEGKDRKNLKKKKNFLIK